jgi:glycine dehydrogenase subunit 2
MSREIKGAGLANSSVVMGHNTEPTIFDYSHRGRSARQFRDTKIPSTDLDIPKNFLREELLELADVSERDVVAHFTRLTHRQYSVDLGTYPLGSCTMKYNPKLCDDAANIKGFSNSHPSAPSHAMQGWLELLYNLEQSLCAIVGMSAVSLQPPAGAAGELTGLLLMRAYHDSNQQNRHKIIIPDSAHGTNPASVTLGGYKTVTVPSNEKGLVDIEALKSVLDDDIAGMMLTNPNTLGLFEEEIADIANLVHGAGGLMYYDGANLNAILGMVRPGDMGFDIVHMNLHKTFAVPHGGGGPGAGPVGVNEKLAEFLPGPIPTKLNNGEFGWQMPPKSIGQVHGWHGNALALLRAYSYLIANGADGLKAVAQHAVLNANYVRVRIASHYDIPFNRTNMHEFVASANTIKRETNVRAFDIAKALLDRGFHSPTMYFPLTIDEALMIEPTETESKETLDALSETLIEIAELSKTPDGAEQLHEAPRLTPVSRVDEARAARQLITTADAV